MKSRRSAHQVQDDPEEDAQTLQPDNTYGDPLSDAFRRDLTINGLFYDLKTFTVIDYVGGLDDLKAKVVRIIGEPVKRIVEDPVRMIRAVRHAARAGFSIEPVTFDALCTHAHLLKEASKPRILRRAA